MQHFTRQLFNYLSVIFLAGKPKNIGKVVPLSALAHPLIPLLSIGNTGLSLGRFIPIYPDVFCRDVFYRGFEMNPL